MRRPCSPPPRPRHGPPRTAPDASITVDNTTAGTIYDNGCGTFFVDRYFLVTSHFSVSDVKVGLNVTLGRRGDLMAKLTSPKGTVVDLIAATSGDSNTNYDILFDATSTSPLNDDNTDDVASPYYDRTVQAAALGTAFDNEDAFGGWRLYVCDGVSGTIGAFNRAQLQLTGTNIVISRQHKQGPGIAETYFMPWPEDQLWTAAGSIFTPSRPQAIGDDEACTNGSNYDANPMQPIIDYSSITISVLGTVIVFDQWEDGYEANATFPTQDTTEVWGDGNLTNGAAPGDADDILASGQVLMLNGVKDSSTLQAVVDFDARDKISSSQPIAVNRVLWPNGASTRFAHAEEVYPTSMWGTDYRLPVGENEPGALNEMFQYTGVSVMAALDGTTLYIDKNSDGTPEVTASLNQGQAYQWDDPPTTAVIGAGLNRNSHIYSNSGHPIQVNLLTGDVCAFYEVRSFPLLPTDLWATSYYNPVGTLTATGGPDSDYAPTYVHLYNPNSSIITVNYAMGGGAYSSLTVHPHRGTWVQMTDLMGGHFYSSSASDGTYSQYVRDQFGAQSYTNQDGTYLWNSNWIETGDDASPTAGSILINSNLRFYFGNSAYVGDTIEREVDLSDATAATLSFTYNKSSTEAGDILSVYASGNGGSTWTQVGGDILGSTTGGFSQSIAGYMSGNTRIRIQIAAWSGDTTAEYIYVDDVNIAATFPGAGSALPFYAVATVDSEYSEQTAGPPARRNDTYDWGITLVPETQLSQALTVGWAPGDDPTYQGTAPENTAPIWLTGGHPNSTSNTTFDICIDDGGNGGSLTDPYSGKSYGRKITGIAPRTQQKIYTGGAAVAGQDQSGTQIWICDGGDTLITAAWGEDPLTAATGKPAMDMGFAIRNVTPTACVPGAIGIGIAIVDGKVQLTWTSADGVNGYQVHRSDGHYFTPATPYRSGAISPWSDPDTNVENPAANYTYLLRAPGCSEPSSQRVAEFDFALTPGQ